MQPELPYRGSGGSQGTQGCDACGPRPLTRCRKALGYRAVSSESASGTLAHPHPHAATLTLDSPAWPLSRPVFTAASLGAAASFTAPSKLSLHPILERYKEPTISPSQPPQFFPHQTTLAYSLHTRANLSKPPNLPHQPTLSTNRQDALQVRYHLCCPRRRRHGRPLVRHRHQRQDFHFRRRRDRRQELEARLLRKVARQEVAPW